MELIDLYAPAEPVWEISNIKPAEPTDVLHLVRVEYRKRSGRLIAVVSMNGRKKHMPLKSERSAFGGILRTNRLIDGTLYNVEEKQARAFVDTVNALFAEEEKRLVETANSVEETLFAPSNGTVPDNNFDPNAELTPIDR